MADAIRVLAAALKQRRRVLGGLLAAEVFPGDDGNSEIRSHDLPPQREPAVNDSSSSQGGCSAGSRKWRVLRLPLGLTRWRACSFIAQVACISMLYIYIRVPLRCSCCAPTLGVNTTICPLRTSGPFWGHTINRI